MDDKQLLDQMDATERVYAPEELPVAEQARVRADEGHSHLPPNEPPPAAPVANMGNAPSAAMAPIERPDAEERDPPDDPTPA